MENKKFWCVSRIVDSMDSGCADGIHDTYFTDYNKALDYWNDYPIDDGFTLCEYEDVDGVIVYKRTLRNKPMYAEYPEVDVIYTPSIQRKPEIFCAVDGGMTVSEFLNAEYVGQIEKLTGENTIEVSPGHVAKPTESGVFHINGVVITNELLRTKLCDLSGGPCGRVSIIFQSKL